MPVVVNITVGPQGLGASEKKPQLYNTLYIVLYSFFCFGNFAIILYKFSHLDTNIPTTLTYGVYISQLLLYVNLFVFVL
jgi:hypothetical protein